MNIKNKKFVNLSKYLMDKHIPNGPLNLDDFIKK